MTTLQEALAAWPVKEQEALVGESLRGHLPTLQAVQQVPDFKVNGACAFRVYCAGGMEAVAYVDAQAGMVRYFVTRGIGEAPLARRVDL